MLLFETRRIYGFDTGTDTGGANEILCDYAGRCMPDSLVSMRYLC
jgi:hypothetical protein